MWNSLLNTSLCHDSELEKRTPYPAQKVQGYRLRARAEQRHRFFLAVVLRLRPALIRASRVLPSTPPLSQRVERHFFDGQFGGFSASGIHLCPQTSQTATRIVFQPMTSLYRILPRGHNILDFLIGKPL